MVLYAVVLWWFTGIKRQTGSITNPTKTLYNVSSTDDGEAKQPEVSEFNKFAMKNAYTVFKTDQEASAIESPIIMESYHETKATKA